MIKLVLILKLIKKKNLRFQLVDFHFEEHDACQTNDQLITCVPKALFTPGQSADHVCAQGPLHSTSGCTKYGPEGFNDKSAYWIPRYWWNIKIIAEKNELIRLHFVDTKAWSVMAFDLPPSKGGGPNGFEFVCLDQ